ncbi:MAG: efflux RND transporter periplasmic adaptor subunit [Chloroflexota bacterium]
MKRNNKFIAGILMLALVGLGLFSQQTPVLAAPPAQETELAPHSKGEIVPLATVDQAFELGGTVVEILVSEGDTVRAGDPLIRLDAEAATLAVNKAQAQVQAAEQAVAAAQVGQQQAETAVTRAQENVIIAQAQLDLLLADPLPEEVDAAKARVAAAEAAVSQAIGQRDTSLDVGTPAQIAAAGAQVSAAQANLVTIQDRYDDIINGCFTRPDGTEVCPLYGPVEETTRAQLEAAKLDVAAAQAQLAQLQSGATAGQQQAANGLVTLASANRDVAQAQLDLLLAEPTPEQIEQAEVAVAQAEMGVRLAEVQVAGATTAVQQAEAQLAQTKAAAVTAQTNLDRLTLVAAMDGTVTAVTVHDGELVRAGETAVTLADLSGWMVQTTDFTELDIAKAEVGQEVSVLVDALPGETLTGVITDIAQVAGLAQGDVVYEITISLPEGDQYPLRWGMTTEVMINP